MKAALQTLCLSIIATLSYAQEAIRPEKPKTKLEAFVAQDGVTLVQGFSTIGTLQGMFNSSVSVDSKEIINASSGKKELGITIEVKKTNSGITRDNVSYIDYDEIESLIKGLDYISKIDKSVTKLDDFQADYKTKGDLRISTFSGSLGLFGSSKNSSTYLSVQSGTIGSVTATFKQDDIPQFRNLIIKAKEKLDGIK